MTTFLRVTASRLLDGSDAVEEQAPCVVLRHGQVWLVGDEACRARLPEGESAELRLPGQTILPGFVDVHTHLTLGTGYRTYEDVMEHDSSELMAIRAVVNARRHLAAGVTTLRDCGGRGFIAVAARRAEEAGLFVGPRILASGPPITPTGGHFWWCGGEADNPDAVRTKARCLFKNGVDFLKIMASGGATVGTDSRHSSYSPEEIRAATAEADRVGKKTTAHAIAKAGIASAIEGGVHQIEHMSFQNPDGSYSFDSEAAARVVEKRIVVSPTIQTGYRELEKLRQQKAPSASDRARCEAYERKLEAKLSFVARFRDLGATIVAGTDAIREFGDYGLGLRLLHDAGLSPLEVVRAATSDAAMAIGLQDVGLLRSGYAADVIAVDGNPLEDVTAFARVTLVIRAGRVVATSGDLDEAHDLTPPASGVAANTA